jgi:hypothetical protein
MIFAPFSFLQQAVTTPSGPVLPTIITSGLTIYVTAFNTESYPGTGTTWTSLATGTTYNGQLFNSPTFNSTQPKNFFFDGVDDYVYFGDSSALSNTGSYTWGGWIKFSSYVLTQSFFTRGNDVTGQGGGWSANCEMASGNKMTARVVANGAGRTATGATTISLNTWYYVVGVWQSGNSIKLYINGNLDGSLSTTSTLLRTAYTGHLGWHIARGTGSTFYRNQQVSLFHMYSRVLGASEVLDNFNSTKQYYGY